jgi:RND family efflux transporter MFP subunit
LIIGEWTELLGTTQPLPDRMAKIATPIEGRVLTVLRDAADKSLAEGQDVKAGTVIVQLDTRIVNEQKRQADVAVQLAEIEVRRLEALRDKSTAASPLVSPIELQKARLGLEDALSRQKASEEQVRLHTLTSPISGRLGLIQAVPGQPLAVGTTVAEVVDLSEIDVLCFVPPRTAARLALNMPAKVVPSGQEQSAGQHGKVVFVAQQAMADTGNFAVKVRIPNRDLRLRANAVLRVQVMTKPEEERRTIPETALMEDTDPPGVVIIEGFRVQTNPETKKEEKVGKARKLRAKIGIRDRQWKVVEILSLEDPEKKETVPLEDALFIVKGGAGLEDGDLVKIEEED